MQETELDLQARKLVADFAEWITGLDPMPSNEATFLLALHTISFLEKQSKNAKFAQFRKRWFAMGP